MLRAHRARRRAGATVLAVAVAIGTLALTGGRAEAAGVTTHAWMAARAIDQVTSPQLKALLKANAAYVRSGAHFPDSGYALTNTYGETAHWQRFHDAYLAQIQKHGECTDFTKVDGPCAKEIAFLMGMTGHGMGDEVWDWLFEPNSPDLTEYYTPSDLSSYANEGGAELQMDLQAVAVHKQPTTDIVDFPNHADLLAAFKAAGMPNVKDDELNLGQYAMHVVHQAEAGWAPTHIEALHHAMPWMSHNMITAPGGVEFAAKAIAGEWNVMWGKLLGSQPATSVSITYPADGQRRIPTGWVRANGYQPGSSRGRGGARTRAFAVLTYARPYTGSAGTVSSELPAGSMTMEERDTTTAVAALSGYPRSAPYGPDEGEHGIAFQPAEDLKPCTWYRVKVTSNLVDARNLPVTPYQWDFRTAADDSGARCADDPYTADENFERQAMGDLLDRQPDDAELQAIEHDRSRGLTKSAWVDRVLASQEERELLVGLAFQHYLGRPVDSSGRAYWANKLKTISLTEYAARLLASDEVYRKAGSTNAGYVALMYQLIHGRTVDASGKAYWTKKLDAGLGRGSFAKMLLTSPESSRRTVKRAYQNFLTRDPDPSGLSYWTGVLQRGTDERVLWRSIVLGSEYDRKAQAA
ncbi:MAG: DUF4214 domain-containing protein [Acidimicrobiales bacterium]